MPVGTLATVRAQRTEDLAPAGANLLLANSWHLAQQPGADLVARLGGLRRFMRWDGGILTDSGGYQVFSLGGHAQVDDDGVRLTHPASGRTSRLTPASVVATQLALGSDIAMVLDHCAPSTASHAEATDAMRRTHRWAEASLAARGDAPNGLFGIVQGACHADLRRVSADALTQMPFDGFAIGGLAVGEEKSAREDMTAIVTERLPRDRPRYLMGVGTPLDLLEGVHRGVDLFDCILPTSMAQRGRAYTRGGRVELRRGAYRDADVPLDAACGCPVCARYSRAYLRHLYAAREPLAWTLIGQHNLHFWLDLMARIRAALAQGTFLDLYRAERARLDQPDEDAPATPPVARRRKAPPPTQLGRFHLHRAPAFGDQPAFVSVQDAQSGEVMHSVSAPDAEARRLYVDPPRLRARATCPGDPLVVWDVGLGAGTNAMQVLRAWEEEHAAGRGQRALHLVSFELDLDALRLALRHHEHFPWLRHGAPHALLERGEWTGRAPITWTLRHGDVRAELRDAPVPDVVLWDPFSFQVDAELWQPDVFTDLRARFGDRDGSVHTYTNSTAARAALLAAGFFVGPGPATGPKAETTIAYTRPGLGPLLGEAWLAKWRRSSRAVPASVVDEVDFREHISRHPQWRDVGYLPPRSVS
jgi:queuine tRNA-ribosyltransferase